MQRGCVKESNAEWQMRQACGVYDQRDTKRSGTVTTKALIDLVELADTVGWLHPPRDTGPALNNVFLPLISVAATQNTLGGCWKSLEGSRMKWSRYQRPPCITLRSLFLNLSWQAQTFKTICRSWLTADLQKWAVCPTARLPASPGNWLQHHLLQMVAPASWNRVCTLCVCVFPLISLRGVCMEVWQIPQGWKRNCVFILYIYIPVITIKIIFIPSNFCDVVFSVTKNGPKST